jgi:molybdate transport system ATP-binding protein
MARGRRAVSLDAEVRVQRGTLTINVALHVKAGEVVALLGPNGAGKTSVLRALAGLTDLDTGRICVDGRVLEAPADAVRVPSDRRPIGMVFQDYLLFPHLSALDNVAFGLRCHGWSRRDSRTRAAEWLDRVGLAEVARSRVGALSGGQAQRVALARALVLEPSVLLLDEPLAALDSRTRIAVRAELRRHLEGFPGCAVLVTHDALDAIVLGNRIVVMEHGRVVQEGTPVAVARHPRTDYVARLVGVNLLRGTTTEAGVLLESGAVVATVPDSTIAAGQQTLVAFGPAAVALHRSRPSGSPRNVWPATVVGLEWHPAGVRIELAGAIPCVADVTSAAVAELDLAPGRDVWAAVKATEVTAYPA